MTTFLSHGVSSTTRFFQSKGETKRERDNGSNSNTATTTQGHHHHTSWTRSPSSSKTELIFGGEHATMMDDDLEAWGDEDLSTSEGSDNGGQGAWASMILSKLQDNLVTMPVPYKNPAVVGTACLAMWLLSFTATWAMYRKISSRMDAEDDDCIEDIICSWARRPRRRAKRLPLVERSSKEDARDSPWQRRAWLVVLRARCETQKGAPRGDTTATGGAVGGQLTLDESSLWSLDKLTVPCPPAFASGWIDEGYGHRRYPGGTTSSQEDVPLSFQISASSQPYVQLLTKVLSMKEEDVFRRIVHYL